jgi:hypothetical protein
MRKTGPNPGQWDWDPNAGALGALMRGLSSLGDVTGGKIATPYEPGTSATPSADVLGRAVETASIISPISPSYRVGARFGTPQKLDENSWLPGWRGDFAKAPLTPPSAGDIKKGADTGYTSIRESGLETPSGPLSTHLVVSI